MDVFPVEFSLDSKVHRPVCVVIYMTGVGPAAQNKQDQTLNLFVCYVQESYYIRQLITGLYDLLMMLLQA